ncbi:MAG: helix-turn-helix transcriptional regulator [Lachnospiraceae bacterium]|nr:helix-turn-helix transcriptional regulator [Lachnospiraceae bacterium]MDD6810646.1 helix-turn-helix transcriptional regulator [Lachnospiraceae bacterium]
MSLGENLQFLRKKNDITQEQLAEKLEVSRQSVSKWESDTTYPEMDKLLQICQMFHCSVDDMLQKDISSLYVEDKANYDKHMNSFSKMISLGVGLILLGISVMLFLNGIQIKEEFATVVFFIFLVIAVAILIVEGLQHSDFEKKNPLIENFYTTEEIDAFNKKFAIMIAFGVVTILIGVIVLIGTVAIYPEIDGNDTLESILSAVFFLFITVAV